MNYQWRSAEAGRTPYVVSPSGPSPFPIRPSFQDAIRPGTVASRIQSLQKLASPSPPRSHPPPISIPRGEDSRTGFGRRMNSRFGKPALQNTNPDEEPHMETACHSFLGLNTPRVNHEEQHAISNRKTKLSRSPGINSQIIPDGMIARTQHDAVAPWGVLSRSHRTRSMGRHVTEFESDAQTESNFSKKEARLNAESSPFRSDVESRYLDLYRRNIEPRPAYDTMNSEISNATNSTTRRQSVRDLFKDFGIERPAGLASRETYLDKLDPPKIARRDTQCHVCLRVNSNVSATCSKCSHKLCSQCGSSHGKETVGNQEQDQKDENLALNENRSTYQAVNENNPKARPRKEIPLPSHGVSKPPTKLPGMQAVDLFASLNKPSRAFQQDQSVTEPMATPFWLGSQVPSRVKDSPFLIADLLASNRSLPSRQVGSPFKVAQTPFKDNEASAQNDVGYRKIQNHQLQELEKQQGISSSSDGNKCRSSTCRATHHSHQPYRHAASCNKMKRHRHAPKDTDKGYSADTSCFEEAAHLHSKRSRIKEHRAEAYSHEAKTTQRPTGITSPSTVDPQASSAHETLEFVECHGYPRTGHSHLGSPVSSGVVGECQHCLHDCHCDACKSTYHSVRCCVHGDHQPRTHRHLTPRKGPSVGSEKDINGNTAQPSNMKSPKSVDPVYPKPKQIVPRTTTKPQTESARQDKLSGQRSLDKIPSLLRAKRSSLLVNQSAKPPTPPPWVSSPRKGSIAGTVKTELWQETGREDVQTVSSGKPPADLPPSSKEEPFGSPTAPCDEYIREGRLRRSNDALAALRYLYENDEKRRASLRRPSMRSIFEKLLRPPSTRSPSRMQASPPGSRASRKLSALFQPREQNSVPLLNQKLLEHQEVLRHTQNDCNDKPDTAAKGGGNQKIVTCKDECTETNPNFAPQQQERKGLEADCCGKLTARERAAVVKQIIKRQEEEARSEIVSKVKPLEKDRAESVKGTKPPDTARKKRWRIRLVDRKPSHACVNDEPVEQHRLTDDEVVSGGRNSALSLQEQWTDIPPPDAEDHECIWKSRLLEQESKRLGIQGVTVLLYLEKRENVVFEAIDWKGGEVRMED
jgi:hypothetical protein